jgi:hypothetical protein
MSEIENRQLLHLVFGGELKSLNGTEFRDLSALHVVGIYPNYKAAYDAWKAAAQRSVDNALMRYFIVHVHRLLDPSTDAASTVASTVNSRAS